MEWDEPEIIELSETTTLSGYCTNGSGDIQCCLAGTDAEIKCCGGAVDGG